MLWNIPKLSDYFIYLNDDFFFNAEAQITDFLEEDHIVVYGHWRSSFALKTKLTYRTLLQKMTGKPVQPKHMFSQMLSADILGMNEFFEIHHYPHIVDRQIFQNYLLKHPALLETQIKFKFRSVEQINPITLVNHLKIQKNQAILKPDIELAYLKNEKTVDQFIKAVKQPDIKYGCMQSLDQLDHTAEHIVITAMNEKFKGFLPASLHIEAK